MKRLAMLALVLAFGISCDDSPTSPSANPNVARFTAILLPSNEVPPVTNADVSASGTMQMTMTVTRVNEQWLFGGTFMALSGGPITAFGVSWPGEDSVASYTSEGSGGGTGWICVSNCTAPNAQRVYEYSPRGAFGNMPWTYDLSANVTWTLPVEDVDLNVRFAVYNLLNDQEVINIRSRYEKQPGVYRTTFGEGTRWQSPRYGELVLTWNF